MEKLIKNRSAQKTAYKRVYEETVRLLNHDSPDLFALQGNINVLTKKIENLSSVNKDLVDFMLDNDLPDEEIDDEMIVIDKLTVDFQKLKLKIDNLLTKNQEMETSSILNPTKRKLNYPIIDFKKFGGEIADWLSFWSQFKRIHEDDAMDKEDKFQLLIQYTIPKSRARILVESYPPTKENYDKVIDSFKSRFGREDLLIEFYVRELLKLVMQNLKTKCKLSFLFDKLESQLRAIESLGVTTDKCAAILYPMVESCLPEDTLRAWQRNTEFNTETTLKNRLDKLMAFIRKEVEGEERITLATSAFDLGKNKYEPSTSHAFLKNTPTAADLFNQSKPRCVFCKESHPSSNCFKAMKMSHQEKKKVLSNNGCCHLCLKFGHISRKCRSAHKLKCEKCEGRHTTVMCFKNETDKEVQDAKKSENLSNQTYNNQVFLQTLVVNLKKNDNVRPVRVIFDTGSQRSYICKQTAVDMDYKALRTEELVHGLFGGLSSEVVQHNCYRIAVENMNQKYECTFEALDQPMICGNLQSLSSGEPWKTEISNYNIQLNDDSEAPIEILIGADYAGKLFTGNKHDLKCGIVLLETKLGWTVMGKTKQIERQQTFSAVSTSMLTQNWSITDIWNLETIGIMDPSTENSKQEREMAVKDFFVSTITQEKDGRYVVRLPWIENHPPLPNNYNISKKRLDNLMIKLNNDGYYDEYNKVFNEWLDEKIIEETPRAEKQVEGHYLPHRHVVKLSSATTKLRPVFDASAREKNSLSLNQCLEKGINLIELIPSILLRFRLGRIGVIADIRKAFLQIGLFEEDRNFLKFLWYDKAKELITYRHARVVFGVTSSPYLLAATINYHLEKCLVTESTDYSKSTISRLLKSFYVDNCVTSLDNKEDLQLFIKESKAVMSEAQFDLRLWESTILEPEEDFKVSQVLGLSWNRNLDTLELSFSGFDYLLNEKITKKIILSVTNSIFDPNGFSCPVLLIPKLLIQKAWILKLDWNKEVPDEIKDSFLSWLRNLNLLKSLKIPRWVLQDSADKIELWELHLFCDASKDAYAAACFLRTKTNGNIHVQLIQAKSRVAPINKTSIPRLELLAATIGTRLLIFVRKNLDVENINIFCWSDSTTVISWIKRQDKWKPFVKNRVDEIRMHTQPENWYHIPGQHNIADLPSRGCSAQQLFFSCWWEGPLWLKKDRNDWPIQDYVEDENLVLQERCKEALPLTSTLLNKNIDPAWYYKYFSDYQKILRLVAWVKRFVYNCRNQVKLKGQLAFEEIIEAEVFILKKIQDESFDKNIKLKLASLLPFEDKNFLLRIRTKISERKDLENFRYPVLLPAKHPVVSKLIFDYHLRNCHTGVQSLMKILREKYWILGGRKTIKSVVSKCLTCKKFDAQRMDAILVPLPEDRVKDATVFEITGMDFAGPLYLKNGEKIWISIFTCAVYRAVHLELVGSLSTKSFLLALKRFIARRGRPATVYSDNATNYRGSDNAFATLDWNEIQKYSTIERIHWKFSPPTAPWWGGWWERLIRILKQILRKVLGKACLNYEELSSILCECEAVMNSRPLTYLSEDPKDLTCLSPSMFLLENPEVGVADIEAVETCQLRKRYQYRKHVSKDLKNRFRSEYLGTLSMKNKKNITYENIKVGSMVLVESELKKRTEWPLGRIEKVFPGKDGQVRLVEVRTSFGKFLRPIQRVFLLEMGQDEETRDIFLRKNKTLDETDKGHDLLDMDSKLQNNVKYITKSGRRVQPPSKMNL